MIHVIFSNATKRRFNTCPLNSSASAAFLRRLALRSFQIVAAFKTVSSRADDALTMIYLFFKSYVFRSFIITLCHQNFKSFPDADNTRDATALISLTSYLLIACQIDQKKIHIKILYFLDTN